MNNVSNVLDIGAMCYSCDLLSVLEFEETQEIEDDNRICFTGNFDNPADRFFGRR